MSNIVEPVLESCHGEDWEKSVSEEAFLVEFKKVAECVAKRLKEQPVIVAHSENAFDGSDIKRLLSNKFELDKVLCDIRFHLIFYYLNVSWKFLTKFSMLYRH